MLYIKKNNMNNNLSIFIKKIIPTKTRKCVVIFQVVN